MSDLKLNRNNAITAQLGAEVAFSDDATVAAQPDDEVVVRNSISRAADIGAEVMAAAARLLAAMGHDVTVGPLLIEEVKGAFQLTIIAHPIHNPPD